jgi:aryl sulfotransferase
LPVEALVFSPDVKYLYIGRDGRDIAWSIFNFHYTALDPMYEALNDTPGRVGPPLPKPDNDVHKYYQEFVQWNGYPWWEFWGSIRSWWDIRHLPNVMFLHYQNLKDDMEGMMRKIARFLDIPIDEQMWPEIVRHCTFEYMKAHATPSVPMGGIFWEGGAETFIYKGTNGRWRDVLSPEEIETYEALAVEELGDECAHWLATGALPPGG